MNAMTVVDLTGAEMLSASGGGPKFNCWAGGFLLGLGICFLNPDAIAIGGCLIVDYC